MLNRLTKIISTFKFVETKGIPLTVEEGHKQLAQYLIDNGVLVTPCVVYNKKHERYQIVKVGKQLHRFSSKFYRNRGEAEKALEGGVRENENA